MTAVGFADLLEAVQSAGEDFEWYPTTDRMIEVVARNIPIDNTQSLMDIGAGDGRVLLRLAKRCKVEPLLYAIEKSNVLIQAQPENVIPVGTDLLDQNLACLPVDYIFCNPPYSQFEMWVTLIIDSGHARKAFLVIPRRWKESALITAALKRRGATTNVLHSDDFLDAERRARATVDIVQVSFPCDGNRWEKVKDPFDIWFDQNIDTFDAEDRAKEDPHRTDLVVMRQMDNIHELVAAFNEEYARMEENYRAIFRLDYALLKELGVSKDAVREGIKKKMAGLKTKYWELLFERLDTITNRLSTATRKKFMDKLTGRAAVAFTVNNAYAVVLWAIKNANKYFGEQTVQLFRDLSTFEGVMNYKSNQRVWEKRNGWRYHAEDVDRYGLDYRIVVERYAAIGGEGLQSWDYPGHLYKGGHDLIADIIAVMYNLGFQTTGPRSSARTWLSGSWENWHATRVALDVPASVMFQVKAFKNGNMHFRFHPDAIKALNVEAGRLLGWLHSAAEVETELGYKPAEAQRFYASTRLITPSSIRFLSGASPAEPQAPQSNITTLGDRAGTEVTTS